MTWHLFSSPRSPFVRKVMIAAYELGLENRIERQDVVTTPMSPAADVVALNPTGMIPTLIADGEMIFDSLVILDFMNDAARGSLFGDGPGRYAVLARHAVANAAMDKAVRMLDEQFRVQNDDTAEHLSGFGAAILRTAAWMEPRLSAARFDAGDIGFAALLAYLDLRFPHIAWRAEAAGAAAWFETVSQRPAMTATAFVSIPAPA